MERKEILELFLKNGILLSPEEFEAIDEKNYMQVFRQRSAVKSGGEISVSVPRSGRMTCDQFIRICNNRFECLREEILRKTEAVSINKGKKVFAEVTIIGRVREITSKGFTVEDVTGETEAVCDGKGVAVGDVLGLKGFFRENRFIPSRIIWPDVPLGNSPAPAGLKMTLTASVAENMHGIIVCPSAEKAANVATGFGRLGTVRVSRHDSSLTIMAYSSADEVNEEAAVMMLKKRTVPGEDIVENLISEIPGVLWVFNNKRNWTRVYRGVLIVSTDAGSFAEYDGGEVTFGRVREPANARRDMPGTEEANPIV